MIPTNTTPEPVVGSTVRFKGFTATATKIGADATIDLLYYEAGVPRFAAAVRHGHEPDQWLSEAQWVAGRPLTPLGEVEAAHRRGEPAPKIGLRVVFAEQIGKMGYIHTRPTRADIIGITSMTVVDLAILGPNPPQDPLEEDRVLRTIRGVQHATLAEPKIVKQAHAGHWGYAGESLLVEMGPVLKDEIFPQHRCSSCGKQCSRVHNIYFDGQPESPAYFRPPDATVGVCCIAAVRKLVGIAAPASNKTLDFAAMKARAERALGVSTPPVPEESLA